MMTFDLMKDVRRLSLINVLSEPRPDYVFQEAALKLSQDLVAKIASEMVTKKVHVNDPVNLVTYRLDALVMTPGELSDLLADAVTKGMRMRP